MKIHIVGWSMVTLLLSTPISGFTFSASNARRNTQLLDTKINSNPEDQSFPSWLGKMVATTAITVSMWGAPSLVAEHIFSNTDGSHHQVVSSFVASAKEMASGTGSRVNKDADSLLRLGLPIQNKEVRTEQGMELETGCHWIGLNRFL